jgi:hypothetical protein
VVAEGTYGFMFCVEVGMERSTLALIAFFVLFVGSGSGYGSVNRYATRSVDGSERVMQCAIGNGV